ncbi:MAG TPA: hypothetical protein VFS67_35510 [Polyangiaceae bacterium]|nr:hypothetical protein [Polyangiaceae bacterium]
MRDAEHQAAVRALLGEIRDNTRRIAEACERAALSTPAPAPSVTPPAASDEER